MLSLGLKGCAEIIFFSGHDAWAHTNVAHEFNNCPKKNSVTHKVQMKNCLNVKKLSP